MPFILITGIPSSGKTTRTEEIKQYLEKNDKNVFVISESAAIIQACYEKNAVYMDAQKEKQIRGFLKSEVKRLIGTDTVIILDGGNYIKGYRYELYCATKAINCTRITVHCDCTPEQAYKFNENREDIKEKYTREVFDALVMRYETPDSNNRWDSPLFIAIPEQTLNLEAIRECLFEKKPPPQNMSTQDQPISSTNFLYEVDRLTQEVDKNILTTMQLGPGAQVRISDAILECPTHLTAPQLTRLRRQFISYTKTHMTDVKKVPVLYLQYLKTNLNC